LFGVALRRFLHGIELADEVKSLSWKGERRVLKFEINGLESRSARNIFFKTRTFAKEGGQVGGHLGESNGGISKPIHLNSRSDRELTGHLNSQFIRPALAQLA
jgi:hypothetical protein